MEHEKKDEAFCWNDENSQSGAIGDIAIPVEYFWASVSAYYKRYQFHDALFLRMKAIIFQ